MADGKDDCSRPVGSLIVVLDTIASLTDAEQHLLASIISGDWPQLDGLIANTTLIGRLCEAGRIDGDLATSLCRLGNAAWSAAVLSNDDRDALCSWFTYGDRTSLYARGLSDSDIGILRVIPDDIWPQEPQYSDIRDGTLTFPGTRDGRAVTKLRFGNAWFEWYDLHDLVCSLE